MRTKTLREIASLGLPLGPGADAAVAEADLARLPELAQRYLRFMGVVGQPRVWSMRVGWKGRFRTRPGQGWMRCEAWQYNSELGPSRIFHIRVRFAGVVPVVARDTYVEGRGRMVVRVLDLVTVEDATGPELDRGELVTYLNDAVLLAPSMLLGPYAKWAASDESSFDIALTDGGRSVTGRVSVDERGAPTSFSTMDRFVQDPANPDHHWVRTGWSTPVEGWEVVQGHTIPTSARAIWHLPDGPFAYAELRPLPGSLAYNLQPGD
jgi:hypothetical protein